MNLLSEAQIMMASSNVTECEAEVVLPETASVFKGHFPSLPIVPGVMTLGLAIRIAEMWLKESLHLRGCERLKFMRLIRPGERMHFQLTARKGDGILFVVRVGDALCAKGCLRKIMDEESER